MREQELVAQNENTLSIGWQALHLKRMWLLLIAFFVYIIWGFVPAAVVYFVGLVVVSRLFPLKLREKDQIIVYFVARKASFLSRQVFLWLSKKTAWFMNFSLLFSIVLAQEKQSQPPAQQKEEPKQEEVIQYKKEEILFIKEEDLRKIIKELEKKEKIIRQQESLTFGGEMVLTLRGVNLFKYHPDLPLLFIFDRGIKHVLMYTSSAKAAYERNVLFLGPPQHEDGRVFGFAVILEDGNAYYFAGEKVSLTDPTRKVTVYYRFSSPIRVEAEALILSFLKQKGRCPFDGESLSFGGKTFIFRKLSEKILRDDNEVFCGNSVYKLVEF